MGKSHLRLVAPSTVNRTVALGRKPNKSYRTREHLTETEVEKLIKVAATAMLCGTTKSSA